MKLVDLWRVESGVPVQDWLTNPGELEIIRAARQRGRGVLFITLHLGNWEHGGLLLAQLGIPLTVLTQAEPDDGLTDLRIALRQALRGRDPDHRPGQFRLCRGHQTASGRGGPGAIAGSPAGARAVSRWNCSAGRSRRRLAAAELARASGCALIGVTIVRRRAGYAVKVLPEFTYDRKALGNREARRELTRQILRAFEPQIRQDIDQWYQFVPIWPKDV